MPTVSSKSTVFGWTTGLLSSEAAAQACWVSLSCCAQAAGEDADAGPIAMNAAADATATVATMDGLRRAFMRDTSVDGGAGPAGEDSA